MTDELIPIQKSQVVLKDEIGAHYFATLTCAGIRCTTEYVRIAPKKGLLSFSANIPTNSENSNYNYIKYTELATALGLTFKVPTAGYFTGMWHATTETANSGEKGKAVRVKEDGYMEPYRQYQDNGAMGGWQKAYFSGDHLDMWNIWMEEV